MTTELVSRHCKPCEGGVEPLRPDQTQELMRAIHPDWILRDDNLEISRTFKFPGFGRTMGFVNAVAWIATIENHHPEMIVNYGSCEVRYSTHAINGLSDNDFICAAKIDRLVDDTASS